MIEEKNQKIYKTIANNIVENNINKIIISGSGTSYHVGLCVKELCIDICGIHTDVVYPFMVEKNIFEKEKNILFIGISQGGSSLSICDAMKCAKENCCKTLSITGTDNAYISTISDYNILVPCKEELACAKTKGYVCSVLSLMILIIKVANKKLGIEEETYIRRIKKVINNIPNIIDKSKMFILAKEDILKNTKDIKVIATKDNYATALESGLKLLETMRVPVSSYEFEEFLHGAYNAVDENTCLIIVYSAQQKERINMLIHILGNYTKNILIIGDGLQYNLNEHQFKFIEDKYFSVLEYIIPIQMICATIPQKNGINQNEPKDMNFHKKMKTKKY